MNALLLAGALCLAGAPPDGASETPTLTLEHDGRNLTGFVVYATRQEDGERRRFDAGLPERSPDGEYRIQLPPLDDGTWRFQVAAYNGAGESAAVAVNGPTLTVGDPGKVRAAARDRPRRQERSASTPKKPAETAEEKGVLRRLWRVIVGGDDPPKPKPR